MGKKKEMKRVIEVLTNVSCELETVSVEIKKTEIVRKNEYGKIFKVLGKLTLYIAKLVEKQNE